MCRYCVAEFFWKLRSSRVIRHVGGAKFDQAFVRNVRTYTAMPREKAQAAPIARPKVAMRRLGADCSAVVTKRGNARGAKGAGHRHELGSTGSYREEPECFSGRRQPSCDGTSRMTRECHVRICERLGVRFPGPTRQKATSAKAPAKDIPIFIRLAHRHAA